MKRIGVLGGSFDPIHLGHMVMAQAALEQLKLDKVLFVPTNISPHKQKKNYVTAKKRLSMVQLAIKSEKKFEISDVEIKRAGKSYSIDTIRALNDQFNDKAKIFFIIGQDNYLTLGSWKDINELLKMVTFAVAGRPGNSKAKKDIKVHNLKMPIMDISSTFIRKSIAQGKSVEYYVPSDVWSYIKRNKLYILN